MGRGATPGAPCQSPVAGVLGPMALTISPSLRGLGAMALASSIWGLSGIFYKMLAPVPPLEVLAHRTFWAFVVFAGALALQGRLGHLTRALRGGPGARVWPSALAAILISINWFGFIYSVQVGKALEASLGYYIFPLVAVALGVLVFRDSLSRVQAFAVGLAALAVLLLTLGLGVAPWIALVLATTFGLYGLVKKLSPLGPMVSTAAEVALLAPLALTWLWGVHFQGWLGPTGRPGGVFGSDWQLSLLLILSGPITGVPLMLFSYASKRIPLTTVGLVQYLNPTLQFSVAVLVFGELFTFWHGLAFGLIWTALALYSGETLRGAMRGSDS